MPEQIYIIADIAKMFEVTPQTVYAWINGERKDGLVLKAEKQPTFWPPYTPRWIVTAEEVERFANALYGRE